MMTEKSWDTLYEKYPDLFVNKDKTPMQSPMSFGIEVNCGWYDIISSVCYQITNREKNIKSNLEYCGKNNLDPPELEAHYMPVTFDQVKEKYGGLRIYFSGGDDYVDGLISMAEEMSYKICERCGCPGSPNKQGWIMTLCDKCREDLVRG